MRIVTLPIASDRHWRPRCRPLGPRRPTLTSTRLSAASATPTRPGPTARPGMGRSFYRLTAETAVEDFKSGLPFHHPASDTYFNVLVRGGKYFQRRWQIGFDGRETNVEEKQIDFVLGSGNHARTYLHLTAARHAPAVASWLVLGKGRLLGDEPGLRHEPITRAPLA